MPSRNTISPKPMETPSMCGSVRAKPKFSPELISMMLFGPGVNSITTAKRRKAARSSRDMENIRSGRFCLYPFKMLRPYLDEAQRRHQHDERVDLVGPLLGA